MRTVVELSEKDIIQTIANAFDVDTNKVSLIYNEIWVGYAQNEHKDPTITAKVAINENAKMKTPECYGKPNTPNGRAEYGCDDCPVKEGCMAHENA